MTTLLLSIIASILGILGTMIVYIMNGHSRWMATLSNEIRAITREVLIHVSNDAIHMQKTRKEQP